MTCAAIIAGLALAALAVGFGWLAWTTGGIFDRAYSDQSRDEDRDA
jgi:hypothetical protein